MLERVGPVCAVTGLLIKPCAMTERQTTLTHEITPEIMHEITEESTNNMTTSPTDLSCSYFAPGGSDKGQACRRSRNVKPHRKTHTGPCAVYLIVHGNGRRFKIGLSNDAWIRGHSLPEGLAIQWHRSLQVVLPSRTRAHQIESMLHRALAGFRLDLSKGAGGWDGSTEWFHQDAFRHAVNLLQVTPVDDDGTQRARLVPAEQRSLAPAASSILQHPEAPTHSGHAPAALSGLNADYNLERMADIVQLLTTMGWQYRIELVQAGSSACAVATKAGPGLVSATLLHIHGLNDANSVEVMRDRYRIMNTDFWAFRSTSARSCRRVVPLVRFISVLQETPDAVTLEINGLHLIRRLPHGQHIIAQWRALCRQLKAGQLPG